MPYAFCMELLIFLPNPLCENLRSGLFVRSWRTALYIAAIRVSKVTQAVQAAPDLATCATCGRYSDVAPTRNRTTGNNAGLARRFFQCGFLLAPRTYPARVRSLSVISAVTAAIL